jgi:MinD-like ATPase involved in chromosome partitioning or flagellar assembly
MREPEVALAFSPEPWVEALHRHCTDHGGARVRELVLDPATLLEVSFDVLVASHRWPPLTAGLVRDVHDMGGRVLGIHDLGEPEAARHLAQIGVDAVATTDGGPGAIVGVVADLAPEAGRDQPLSRPPAPEPRTRRGRRVVVGGAPGCGRSEIAIELARQASATGRVALVDGDDVAPAIAARLGLPIEPNLRSAVERVEHGRGSPVPAVTRVEGTLDVVAGLPNPGAWEQVRPSEVERVLAALERSGCGTVVLDVAAPLDDVGGPPRGRYALARHLVACASDHVAVGAATPVGVARLLAWLADAAAITAAARWHVVLNRAPRDAFRGRELAVELLRTYPAASLTLVPADRRVEAAAWAGELVGRGPFTRALRPLTARLLGGEPAGENPDDLVPGAAA